MCKLGLVVFKRVLVVLGFWVGVRTCWNVIVYLGIALLWSVGCVPGLKPQVE